MISNKIEISDQNLKCVMSIERDRIWVDPTVSVDETAQAVIDALQEYIVGMVDVAVKEEREQWQEKCNTYMELHDAVVKDNDRLYAAVANLIRVKGRHNTELAYQRLIAAYDKAQGDNNANE